MDSNQNIETGKPATDDVAANEQNILPADIPPPTPLENQSPPPETIPPQTQPPMEVHHHAHTARKKWTHYFWEFLMLFLAVFCGFLAENQREHFVEANRAKEYAQSLLVDMRSDTVELKRGVDLTVFIMSAIDSIASILLKQQQHNTVPGKFYMYSKFISYSYRIDWSRSTIDQLIQSGNLRYFRNKELIRTINYYYYIMGLISAQNQVDGNLRDKAIELRNSILVYEHFSPFVQNDFDFTGQIVPSATEDSLTKIQVPLQKDSDLHTDKYLNYLADRKARLKSMTDYFYSEANGAAIKIINLLISEYHLK